MAHLTFSQAIITTMKARVFDFHGRSCRSEFWFGMLFLTIVQIPLIFLGLIPVVGPVIVSIGTIWLFFARISVTVRRLHDVNRSGWNILMPFSSTIISILPLMIASSSRNDFIALVSSCIALILIFGSFGLLFFWLIKSGTPGDNSFGSDPLQLDPEFFINKKSTMPQESDTPN